MARGRKEGTKIKNEMPSAVDVERIVIGSILLSGAAMPIVVELIHSEDVFSDSLCKCVFQAALELYEDSDPIDLVTIVNKMMVSGTLQINGGAHAVSLLTDSVGSITNLDFYCKIILEKYVRRIVIENARDNALDAYDETIDTFEFIQNITDRSNDPISLIIPKTESDTDLLFDNFKLRSEKIQGNGGRLLGISSGMPDLDKVTNGWQDERLYIIGGRPGMGKTSLALSLIRNAIVIEKVPVAFFSVEMGEDDVMAKFFSFETKVTNSQIERGDYDDSFFMNIHQVRDLYKADGRSLLFIEGDGSLSTSEFIIKARRLKRQHGIRMIVVDYLQLMSAKDKTSKGGTKAEEVNEIAKCLKRVAKQLKIPIIALSQLNRGVEARADRRPMLSDLKESAGVEENADLVIFPFRMEYYKEKHVENMNSYMVNGEEIPCEGKCELIIPKNRHGACRDVLVNFENETTLFYQEGYHHTFLKKYQALDASVSNKLNMGDIGRSLYANDSEAPF